MVFRHRQLCTYCCPLSLSLPGDLMAKGKISEKLVDFADSLFGFMKGGLSIVAVLAGMFFAAISGSGAATTAAVGTTLVPELKKKGYDEASSASSYRSKRNNRSCNSSFSTDDSLCCYCRPVSCKTILKRISPRHTDGDYPYYYCNKAGYIHVTIREEQNFLLKTYLRHSGMLSGDFLPL